MSFTCNQFSTEIEKLRQYYYSLSWVGKLFFPLQLKRILKQPAFPFKIIQIAWEKTFFFHIWLFKGLRNFFSSEAIQATQWLYDHLNINHKILIKKLENLSNTDAILAALCTLNLHRDALAFLEKMLIHPHPQALSEVIILFNQLNLLDSCHAVSLSQALLNYKKNLGNRPVNEIITLLDSLELLCINGNDSDLLTLLIHPQSNWVERNLFLLYELNILNSTNKVSYFHRILNHPNPEAVYSILSIINQAQLFQVINPENLFDCISTHPHIVLLKHRLSLIYMRGLFSTEDAIIRLETAIQYTANPLTTNQRNRSHNLAFNIPTEPRFRESHFFNSQQRIPAPVEVNSASQSPSLTL